MKELKNDSFNFLEILIENYNDIWTLNEILSPDDIVGGETTRKIKVGDEINYKIVRKKFYLKLKISDVKIENDFLVVRGFSLLENDFITKNSLQILRFTYSNKIQIEKSFLKFQKKILVDSFKILDKNLLILVDNDSLICSEFDNKNFNILFFEKNLGNKKRFDENQNDLDLKYKIIKPVLENKYNSIIVAGPAFWKNQIQEKIKSELNLKSVLFSFNDVSENSVGKVIKELTQSGILSDNNLSLDYSLIEQFQLNLSQNKNFCYGFDNCLNHSFAGAIDTLLISSNFLEKAKEEDFFKDLKDIINSVENQNGRVFIVNSKFEPGQILDGFGGFGGICRFNL